MYLYVCLYTIYSGIQKLQDYSELRWTPLQVRGSKISTSKRGAENLDAYRIALVKKKINLSMYSTEVWRLILFLPQGYLCASAWKKCCSVIKLTTTPDFSEYICFCKFGTNAPYECIWPVTWSYISIEHLFHLIDMYHQYINYPHKNGYIQTRIWNLTLFEMISPPLVHVLKHTKTW